MEKPAESIRGKIFRSLQGRKKTGFQLRMVPMIDMIFLLLVFFLLTAHFRPEENFLPLQLPTVNAEVRQFGKIEPLYINIKSSPAGCRVVVGQTQSIEISDKDINKDLASLVERIDRVCREQKRTAADPVEIVCEGGVKWEHLARIYNILFGMHISDISFRMTE